MYKYLLSWRYLRTRYIALASVISVTLGVATLIIVNSVMAGFTHEMYKRLNSILSDIVLESQSLNGFSDPDYYISEIRTVVGDDLAGVSASVHVPALLRFPFRGDYITRQINLIGVDEATYNQVSDFGKFLLHPENREQLSFLLREEGYAPEKENFPPSGWRYRRLKAIYEQPFSPESPSPTGTGETGTGETGTGEAGMGGMGPPFSEGSAPGGTSVVQGATGPVEIDSDLPLVDPAEIPGDPYTASVEQYRREAEANDHHVFDAGKEQHTGIILGIALGSVRHRDPEGEVRDYFLLRPGDDVQIMLLKSSMVTSIVDPGAETDTFTVVDLYESKMSEYDGSFAFVPLRKLQQLRGMVHPTTGVCNVTSIQLKLKAGADLEGVCNRLRAHFPVERFPFRIQTWKEMQGPLLAAVQLETTILNILLFLIIAVAGFGILATFFMIVVEKTRDIGILKALGAPQGGVMRIFLNYGFALGLVGSGVGMILGLLFVRYINNVAELIERVTGREVFDPTVYYFQEIPTLTYPLMVVLVAAGAVLIAVLASILPAMRAARLHPVEALRYE